MSHVSVAASPLWAITEAIIGLARGLGLRVVAEGVNHLRSPERGIVVITHYQRLLNYIVPDFVHVLAGGRIVKSGGKELALELEARGYEWLTEPAVTA